MLFTGRAGPHVRLCARVRQGALSTGPESRTQTGQPIVRPGTALGRRAQSLQLHQLCELRAVSVAELTTY